MTYLSSCERKKHYCWTLYANVNTDGCCEEKWVYIHFGNHFGQVNKTSNSIIKGRLLIWGNECNDESVNDTMVQPFKLQFYGCSSYFFLAWNLNNIHPLGDLTSWNIKKKFVSYCLKQKYIEEKQHNETRISSQTNFLIIINHSKEYKDLWAFFKHFNDKENIFPLGCTNQMNSTQIDTNNDGGEFLYIQFITNQWK